MSRCSVRGPRQEERKPAGWTRKERRSSEIARVEAGQDAEGDFHDAALAGLQVRVGDAVVGRIASIVHNPAQDLLVVDTPAGEQLVPFVTALVPVVDLAGGYVEVVDLPGLFEPGPNQEA